MKSILREASRGYAQNNCIISPDRQNVRDFKQRAFIRGENVRMQRFVSSRSPPELLVHTIVPSVKDSMFTNIGNNCGTQQSSQSVCDAALRTPRLCSNRASRSGPSLSIIRTRNRREIPVDAAEEASRSRLSWMESAFPRNSTVSKRYLRVLGTHARHARLHAISAQWSSQRLSMIMSHSSAGTGLEGILRQHSDYRPLRSVNQ